MGLSAIFETLQESDLKFDFVKNNYLYFQKKIFA